MRSFSIPVSLSILMFGPHPDDFDCMAITFQLLKRNGNIIEVGVVRSATGIEDSYRLGLTPESKARLRENEQRDSCSFFGLPNTNLTFLELEENMEGPIISNKNLNRLRNYFLSKRHNIVFLPHGSDTNGGHKSIYTMLSKLLNKANHPVTLFLSIGPRTTKIQIDVYTEFEQKDADWKGKLLRIHDSQQHRNLTTRGYGFDERILNSNQNTAQLLSIGAPYAEGFQLEFYGLAH